MVCDECERITVQKVSLNIGYYRSTSGQLPVDFRLVFGSIFTSSPPFFGQKKNCFIFSLINIFKLCIENLECTTFLISWKSEPNGPSSITRWDVNSGSKTILEFLSKGFQESFRAFGDEIGPSAVPERNKALNLQTCLDCDSIFLCATSNTCPFISNR